MNKRLNISTALCVIQAFGSYTRGEPPIAAGRISSAVEVTGVPTATADTDRKEALLEGLSHNRQKQEKSLDFAWFKGVTDKNPLEYKPGEEMVFTLALQNLSGEIPADRYFLRWERTGDDGIKENGRMPLSVTPFVYKTRIDKPGFVRLYAEVVDADGKTLNREFTGDKTTPEGQAAANRFEQQPRNLFFDGGAGVDIDTLQAVPEPPDFDAFWKKQAERLDRVPVEPKLIEMASPNPEVRMYAVEVQCAGIRPVTGYLTVPKAVDAGAKFPCRLATVGYTDNPIPPPQGARGDEIRFEINAHGMRLPEFGGDDGYYKAFRSEIQSRGHGYAFDPVENADPETAYFNGMALRVKRALQYLKTLPGWDGKKLIASGGSQGGLQTIWAAGSGEGVTLAESAITWGCDIGGTELGRNRGGWHLHWVPALGYYDAVNFAKRVPTSCRVEISRAGLGDYVCPPSGLAILWNNLSGPKKICWVQGCQHDYVPPDYDGRDIVREK